MANDNWETPQYIFDWLNSEFNFLLDAACNSENIKCVFGCCYDRGQDGLTMDWASYGRVWLNPPYSKPYPWVKKAYEESLKGGTIVCLLPADISTKWFHDWVLNKAEIRFVQGRIKFDNPTPGKYSAPKFGSMIAIYGPNVTPKVVGVLRPNK